MLAVGHNYLVANPPHCQEPGVTPLVYRSRTVEIP